jgi:cephalosporin-C deacetylase-like acetyl esterase
MGVSLGAIVGGLAAAIEPRLTHVCLVMGAGELQHILYESSERKAKELLAYWKAAGGTRDMLGAILRPIDVTTYGDRLAKRNVLMFTAAYDEVLPRQCGAALFEASGRQRNVVYPCGHYTMAFFLPAVMKESTDYFAAWPTKRPPSSGQSP